jgi:hypothetical protein
MIVTVYRHDQAYSLAADEIVRVAAASAFASAWADPETSLPLPGLPTGVLSGQLGFVLGQPVLAQEPLDLLGPGRLAGIDLPEEGEPLTPPRHLVLLRACNGDLRHAVWADGLDWQPRGVLPSLTQENEGADLARRGPLGLA